MCEVVEWRGYSVFVICSGCDFKLGIMKRKGFKKLLILVVGEI